jgi:hypothetical protein
MSPCLLDAGSTLTCLDPELTLLAGFDGIEFEDQIAELAVDKCHVSPRHIWQQRDLGVLALDALQNLNPYGWDRMDSDLMKPLMAAAMNVVKQIVPPARRSF